MCLCSIAIKLDSVATRTALMKDVGQLSQQQAFYSLISLNNTQYNSIAPQTALSLTKKQSS